MTAVTECAFIPVASGVSVEDETSPEGSILAAMLHAGQIEPTVQKNYWGRELENPNNVHLMLDWNSLETHKAYQARPEYGPFVAKARSMLDETAEKRPLFHVALQPHPPSAAILSPVCEILTAYFPLDLPDKEAERYSAAFRKLVNALSAADTKGFTKHHSSGWAIEEVDLEGIPCKVFYAAIGWESKEAHTAARETTAFKENVADVVKMPQKVGAVHVKFQTPA